MRIYAPKPQDSYRQGLTRTMVGLPSQLGLQIVNDVCKKAIKLDGCCCSAAVFALWSDKLPVNIRAHISNLDFSQATYKEVFEAADKVYLAARQVSVAAISLNETQPAFLEQNQPVQVAAATTQKKGGSQSSGTATGGRGGRGGKRNRGRGGARTSTRTRHASQPPEECCDRHYSHGADAWYCLAPLTCPWVKKCSPRPST